MKNLYGVLLKNVISDNEKIEVIICFDSLKKAIKYEKEIRFLDNVVSTKEYKEKVERIKEMSKGILLYSEINDTIELVNKYPLLVQFFEG